MAIKRKTTQKFAEHRVLSDSSSNEQNFRRWEERKLQNACKWLQRKDAKTEGRGMGEMARRLRVSAALVEDPGSNPSTDMGAYNCLYCQLQEI